MISKIKNWWHDVGKEIADTAAVATTALTIIYFVAKLFYYAIVTVLGFTGLLWVLKIWVLYAIGYTATVYYLEWRDERKSK